MDEVEEAIGPLTEIYSERDALRLLRVLGDCDAFVAPALAFRHTPEQEAARHRFHHSCLLLSGAIRKAVGYPGRAENEREVVRLVPKLLAAVQALRSAFSWDRKT